MSDASLEGPIAADGGVLFSPKVVLGMILAGVFAFSTFAVLSTYAPDLQSGDNGQGHALSKSAVGYAGLVQLLRARGDPVIVSRRNLSGEEPSLVVFTPNMGGSRDAYQKAQLSSRTLVVLPKWGAPPDPRHPGWVGALDLAPDAIMADALKVVGIPKAALAARKGLANARLVGVAGTVAEGLVLETGPIRDLRAVSGPGLQPVIVDAQGRAILARRLPTDTYFLADPDLLNTMGMKDIRTARSGVAILDNLRKPQGSMAFDVTLNGFTRSRTALKLAFEPPLVGATLCLVAAALLMGLHAAARFRAVRRGERALALGNGALIDNSAGLIRMAKREPAMAPRYAELQRAAAVRAMGGSRLSGQALTDFLDRQGSRFAATDSVSSLDNETRAVRSPSDLMKVAAKWYQWRLEMTRERR
ncbi:hypothetical protein [Caulobacter sp. DWR2-3-1b2]|uniref:hypothetical protein n=1 Tax=Caulobacter sp. DWR2-3-1b2 TaxID=2804642 RepID=UPI003CEA4150